MLTESQRASAFNAGADARLAGRPVTACPLYTGAEYYQREYWLQGWSHVSSMYGSDVARRWAIRPLPPVQNVLDGTRY